MTEEELNGFKELAESINKITEDAFLIYEEQVDKIYTDNVQNVNEIERLFVKFHKVVVDFFSLSSL